PLLACPTLVLFVTPPPPPALSTLSLHDALPIWTWLAGRPGPVRRRPVWPRRPAIEPVLTGPVLTGLVLIGPAPLGPAGSALADRDRKSTRLNSSHVSISYAVFCLKKKNRKTSAH